MRSSEDLAAFWARLFRCTTAEAAEREIRASFADLDDAREVWRAHRAALQREEARFEARARDVEVLQTFGRSLAEARSIDDLFARAAASLQTLADADAVAIAVALPDRSGVEVHIARALAPEDLIRLRASVAAGFVPVDPASGTVRTLPTFDRFHGPRASLSETDVIVVPVERRGREVLRLAVVPRLGASERVLFGASNHLAIHLDRVLAVAEAEQGRFRAILDSMPHAVVLTDASFRIVQANLPAERLLPRLGADPAAALRSVGDLDLVGLSYAVLAGRRNQAEGEAKLPDGGRLEVAVAPGTMSRGRPMDSCS
jgi:PAS domain-containing protein